MVFATNSEDRYRDSMRGALQLSAGGFYRTHTNFILGGGLSFRQNNHEFTISARGGANIERVATASLNLGYTLGKFQFFTQNSYSLAQTYRGTDRNNFGFDQSITYIPNREYNFTIGHSNQGSVLSRDGQSSNVDLFDTRSSVIYLSALYNF